MCLQALEAADKERQARQAQATRVAKAAKLAEQVRSSLRRYLLTLKKGTVSELHMTSSL